MQVIYLWMLQNNKRHIMHHKDLPRWVVASPAKMDFLKKYHSPIKIKQAHQPRSNLS